MCNYSTEHVNNNKEMYWSWKTTWQSLELWTPGIDQDKTFQKHTHGDSGGVSILARSQVFSLLHTWPGNHRVQTLTHCESLGCDGEGFMQQSDSPIINTRFQRQMNSTLQHCVRIEATITLASEVKVAQ